MKTADFYFDLPKELIAQTPPEKRGDSRLLVCDRRSGRLTDTVVAELPRFLPPGALLVFNNSRVRKARVFAESETGGRVEFLFTRRADDFHWEAVTSRQKKQTVGRRYRFCDGTTARISAAKERSRILEFEFPVTEDFFERNGAVPLPPYIKRAATVADGERYQTVYADSSKTGSSAAPTAGLHFTPDLLDELKSRGVSTAFVTLHVGPGTFLPVTAENVEDHKMHTEEYEVSEETAAAVTAAKRDGRPVVAAGTTSVRTLESAWDGGRLSPGRGETDIFIYPGYRFRVVDKLFTNFHTPDSSLILLVSAFAGRETVLNCYRHAVEKRYRFFSYGDATLFL